jgi:hypothetical protein
MQPNLSTPDINFSFVDASRFEPSYNFPELTNINTEYYNENSFVGPLGIGIGLTDVITDNDLQKYTYGDNFRYGGKHGRYLGFKANTTPSIVRASKFAKGAGPILSLFSAASDINDFNNNEMRGTRLGSRLSINAAATGLGMFGLAGFGGLIGGIYMAGELGYDIFVDPNGPVHRNLNFNFNYYNIHNGFSPGR